MDTTPIEKSCFARLDIATNVLGVDTSDGLPLYFFGCYYPCGRIETCVLWQIQTYIYPFFEVGSNWGINYASKVFSD